MNIFYLDHDPTAMVHAMSDKHVNKMLLESAQMLCSAWWVTTALGYKPHALTQSERFELSRFVSHTVPNGLYKPTHTNHPSSVWVRSSQANALWLLRHTEALNTEWQYRFGHTRNHMSWNVASMVQIDVLPAKPCTTPPPVMPANYIIKGDTVQSYKNYYMAEKLSGARFTKRKPPNFAVTHPF